MRNTRPQAVLLHVKAFCRAPCTVSLPRLRPWDLDAATWLGIELVKAQNFKEASTYFTLAAKLQPTENKWRQLAALCLRKSGQFGPALLLYEALHKELPDDANIAKHLKRTRAALGLQHS